MYKPPPRIASQHRNSTCCLHVGPPGNYSVSVLNCRLKQVGRIFSLKAQGDVFAEFVFSGGLISMKLVQILVMSGHC